MSDPDAYKLLSSEMVSYRELSYDELRRLIGSTSPRSVVGGNSTRYATQVSVNWHKHEQGDILIEGWIAVDDCGPLQRIDERFIFRKPDCGPQMQPASYGPGCLPGNAANQ
jgi:hypothetical protein